MTTWYRNAGPARRTSYHAAADDWVRTGRAICGRSIASPAFTSHAPGLKDTCLDCARKVARAHRSAPTPYAPQTIASRIAEEQARPGSYYRKD